MTNTIEFEGKSEKEALEKAALALRVEPHDIDYTIVDEGSQGVLGIGARPTRIRAQVAPTRPEPTDQNDDGDKANKNVVGPAPEKAAKTKDVACALVAKMGMQADVSVRDEDENIVVVLNEVAGSSDVSTMLGAGRSSRLPAFQFILNKIVNRFPEGRKHIVVEAPDVSGPPRQLPRKPFPTHVAREGNDEDIDVEIAALAQLLAERAKSTSKVITVHPMSSADRRSIHLSISKLDGVTTLSEGEGFARKIHVVPAALARGGHFESRRRGGRGHRHGKPAQREQNARDDANESGSSN